MGRATDTLLIVTGGTISWAIASGWIGHLITQFVRGLG